MPSTTKNYADEIKQMRDFETGDFFEPYIRLFANSLAGVLIFIYTGWPTALLWAVAFLTSFVVYFYFVSSRKSFASYTEACVAAGLLALTHVVFAWLPIVMIIGESRVLIFVGGMMLAAQMLYLGQRDDTLRIFNVFIIALVVGIAVLLFIGHLPHFDTPLAVWGAALSAAGMLFYFARTMHVTRQIRQSRESAAMQAHQSQKMAAVGQLAGGVAHDFNNNLTAIIGSLELIQITDDPVEREADVQNALVAARQAATTVRHLMIFARAEKPVIAEIYLSDVCAELRVLTKRLIPTSVTCDISEPAKDIKINADRSQLVAALINLIVNSVDAMPLGGHIAVRAGHVVIMRKVQLADGSDLGLGDHVKITITDTGQGIPEDVLPKVIDPFFTTKPVGKGTGLGLSMVAGMLKELNGGLAISSSEAGTEVNLYLPDTRTRSEKSIPPIS